MKKNRLDEAAVLKTLGVQSASDLHLRVTEEQHILRVLRACGGVRSAAARLLGIPRRTLQRKLVEIPPKKMAGLKPPPRVSKSRRKRDDGSVDGEHVLALRTVDLTWQQIATVLRCSQFQAKPAAKRAQQLLGN